MEQPIMRQARATLHVAGIHCPSCVEHIARLLQSKGNKPLTLDEIVVSHLDNTVSFRLNDIKRGDGKGSDMQDLKRPLETIVKLLRQEGYPPDALEAQWITSFNHDKKQAVSNANQICTKGMLESAHKTDTLQRREAHRLTTSSRVWTSLASPMATMRHWSDQKVRNAQWQKHLQACKACQEGASGIAEDQYTSGSSGTSEALHSQSTAYEVDLAIGGMTCASCVNNIQSAVQCLEGVENFNINLLANSAHAILREKKFVEPLLIAIEDGGYDVHVLNSRSAQKSSRYGPRTIIIELTVGGMTCSACVDNVQRAVEALQFPQGYRLESFHVDILSNQARASITELEETKPFTANALASSMKEQIEDAGYDAAINRAFVQDNQESSLRASGLDSDGRVATIAIEGMFCGQCSTKVRSLLEKHSNAGLLKVVDDAISNSTSQRPQVTIALPLPQHLTLRQLIGEIEEQDPAFSVHLVKQPSPATQSARMARKELRSMMARLLLAFLFVPPTLLIAVIVPTFLSKTHHLRFTLETRLSGQATRADFILLGLATPVQLFVGSIFHTRALKSLKSVWRKGRKWSDRFLRWGDMNVLVSLGTFVAYIASLVFLIVDACSEPSKEDKSSSMLYFDACVFLVFFILLGRVLEATGKRNTTSAIDALGDLRPSSGILITSPTDMASTRTIDVDLLEVGDLVLIPSGASPPLDAQLVGKVGILEKESTINDTGSEIPFATFSEAAISGESRPVNKHLGDSLYAGTANQAPYSLLGKVEARSGNCVIDSVVDAVRSAGTSGQKASLERLADRVTAHFVPAIVLIALAVFFIWLVILFSGAVSDKWIQNHVHISSGSLTGSKVLYALQFGVSCLVIACPCGIGLAAPTAYMVGIGLASKHGILVQGGGQAFEIAVQFAKSPKYLPLKHYDRHFVFDKTGTLTTGSSGQITHSTFATCEQRHDGHMWDRRAILKAIECVENSSTHPIGVAIRQWCVDELNQDAHTNSQEVLNTNVTILLIDELAGRGLRAKVALEGTEAPITFYIGSQRLVTSDAAVTLDNHQAQQATSWQNEGASVVYVALCPTNDSGAASLFAMLAVTDSLRSEAAKVIHELQSRFKTSVWMVSGDTQRTARAIGAQAGIADNQVAAEVLPAEKASWVDKIRLCSVDPGQDVEKLATDSRLSRGQSLVAFVGDGINDAPALAAADLSIALGSGSTLAQSNATFVLMDTASEDRQAQPLLSLLTLLSLSRATHSKVWQNLGWAIIFNVVFIPLAAGVLVPAGFTLGPSWSGLAMALSSTSVVLNALALRLWRPPRTK